MTLKKKEEKVMKADGLRRVRTSQERREALLEEFEESGLSGVKFAALVGIKYQTFAGWVRRRRRERPGTNTEAKPSAPSVRWLEAVVASPARSGSSSVKTQSDGRSVFNACGNLRNRFNLP